MSIEKQLQDNELSITKPRVEIFNLLKSADKPMSTAEIISKSRSINRSTVYRTIELFEKLGVVKKVWFGMKSKFELSDEFEDHHHHIVCEKCGGIEKIDHAQLEKMITRISKKSGFKPTSHHIEVLGICRTCLVRPVKTPLV